MLTFTLKKDSWHYWVANFAERRVRPEYDEGCDICSYTCAFFGGLFWLTLVTTLTTMLSIWALVSLVDLGNWVIFGGYLPPYAQVFGIVVIVVPMFLGLIAFIAFLRHKAEEQREKYINAPRPPPGFVKLAYRKFKDKTCFKLKFQ